MVRGPDSAQWLADQEKGLFAVRDGVAHPLSIPGLESKLVFQLFTDRTRAIWVGYFEGGISVVDGNSLRTYGLRDGLAQGTVQAIAQDRSGAVWVGTRLGLSRFEKLAAGPPGAWSTESPRKACAA